MDKKIEPRQTIGLGTFGRNFRGNFSTAATCSLPHVITVDSAEMTVIRNGMYLAARIGCKKLLVQSECSFVVEAVQQPDDFVGTNMAIVLKCKQLAMHFAEC